MTNDEGKHGWVARLRARWGVSTARVFLILLTFACTGTTVLLLKQPVLAALTGGGEQPLALTIAYYALIVPIYNVILLAYGAVFGQFQFFWAYERRAVGRIAGLFRRSDDVRGTARTADR